MIDEEVPPHGEPPSVLPPGPRRSTYTPPAADATYDPAATDDEALAGALSAQFQRWAPPSDRSVREQSGATESGPAPESPAPESPAPESTASASTASESPASDSPAFDITAPESPASDSPAFDITAPESASSSPGASPEAPAWSPFAADPSVEPVIPPTPPSSVAPPPPPPPQSPSLSLSLSPSLPAPPERRSLSDDELLAAADPAASGQGTAALLDLVEQQLALRAEEAHRLAAWESEVREVAGAQAEPIVAEVRSHFTGVIPIVGGGTVVPAAAQPPAPPVSPDAHVPPSSSPALPVEEALASPAPAVDNLAAPIPEADSAPALDLALADAPPPFGSTAAPLPPPVSEPHVTIDGPVPPPQLVEPPVPAEQPLPTGPTSIEQLLAEPGIDSDAGAAHEAEGVLPTAARASALTDAHDAAAPASSDENGIVDNGIAETGQPAVAVMPTRFPSVELAGLEPTPLEHRAGRSIRMFWLWFAVNSSVVSVALGGVVLGLGMSLRQALFSIVIGVAISFLPLGLGTLAGKWSGQPTMVVSRSTFGTGGNAIPAFVALVTRVVWAAALVWVLAVGVAEVLVGSGLLVGMQRVEIALLTAGVALVIVTVLAALGFRVIAITSAIVSVVSAVLVIGLIALTAQYVDVSLALSLPDGPALLLMPGAVLVFSVVGLAWANSSGDLARYQAKGTLGSATLLSTAFGATIPGAALICWGAILAASNPVIAEGLSSNPVDILSRMLPLWYPAPLIAAIALSLIAAATLAVYSAGFAVLAVGVRAPRPVAVLVALPLVAAATAGLAMLGVDAQSLFRDVATTLAVPVAAWAGIFGSETMIRSRRVHSPSLLRAGGVYPAVRWLNVLALIIITGVGWGFTSAALTGLEWQGWAWQLLGIDRDSLWGGSDIGVFAALLLGLLVPLVAGIPAMRRLQTAERDAAVLDEPPTTGVTTVPTSESTPDRATA